MIKLPQGSARNKIEFLFGLVGELFNKVNNAPKAQKVIPNLLPNGLLQKVFSHFVDPTHIDYSGWQGQIGGAFWHLEDGTTRLLGNGWLYRMMNRERECNMRYISTNYGEKRLEITGEKNTLTLKRIFSLPSNVHGQDLAFRILFRCNMTNGMITSEFGNLTDTGSNNFGTSGDEGGNTDTVLIVSQAPVAYTNSGGDVHVLYRDDFATLDTSKPAYLQFHLGEQWNHSGNQKWEILEVAVIDKNQLTDQELADFRAGNIEGLTLYSERPGSTLRTVSGVMNPASAEGVGHGKWDATHKELSLNMGRVLPTDWHAKQHFILDSLHAYFADPAFPETLKYRAEIIKVNVVRMDGENLVIDMKNARISVFIDDTDEYTEEAALDLANLSAFDFVSVKALYSEEPLLLSNAISR
ncbi:hypothetical protein [Enterovibrio paralichthyis]|uniref:hypothetical protein n=1 Tax=Enterovibrio paralichthyis TaxID=2853805 RepID=UPI001C490E8A|nr:hypothetical protein [Enterovibrio paralichthyis]MBV7296820.1 hypothetical protein [Enterovibrio paralichthyis]